MASGLKKDPAPISEDTRILTNDRIKRAHRILNHRIPMNIIRSPQRRFNKTTHHHNQPHVEPWDPIYA